PFAGFEMPVQYTGVIDEHQTVRNAVGLFDVSHMGEIEIKGKGALEATNRIITNDLSRIIDGQALYTTMCKPDAGIIDDLVVYRFSAEHIFICMTASNRAKDFAWVERELAGKCDAKNVSDDWAQIAVQGPKATELVSRLADVSVADTKTYHFK